MIYINVSGIFGSGKTTIVRYILDNRPEAQLIRRCTSRQQRLDEKEDSLEYEFLTQEEFKQREENGFFIPGTIREIEGEGFYGVPKVENWSPLRENTQVVITMFGVTGSNIVKKELIPDMKLVFLDYKVRIEAINQLCKRSRKNRSKFAERVDKIIHSKVPHDHIAIYRDHLTTAKCANEIMRIALSSTHTL